MYRRKRIKTYLFILFCTAIVAVLNMKDTNKSLIISVSTIKTMILAEHLEHVIPMAHAEDQSTDPEQDPIPRDFYPALILIFSASSLFVLIMIFVLLLRNNSKKLRAEEDPPEAYLYDLSSMKQESKGYKIGKRPMTLGRMTDGTNSDIDHIVIVGASVSRRHALIEYREGNFWITDQGSVNGTFINDRPIYSQTMLKHGDIIRLHLYKFEFAMPQSDGDNSQTVLAKRDLIGNILDDPQGKRDDEDDDDKNITDIFGDESNMTPEKSSANTENVSESTMLLEDNAVSLDEADSSKEANVDTDDKK